MGIKKNLSTEEHGDFISNILATTEHNRIDFHSGAKGSLNLLTQRPPLYYVHALR